MILTVIYSLKKDFNFETLADYIKDGRARVLTRLFQDVSEVEI